MENGAPCAALQRDQKPLLFLSGLVTRPLESEEWGYAGLAALPSCNHGTSGTILAHAMSCPDPFPGVHGQAANSENGHYFYFAG